MVEEEQRRSEAEAARERRQTQQRVCVQDRTRGERQLDIQAQDNAARFPLHFACQFGRPHDVRILLDAGHSIDSVNDEGESVLDLLFKSFDLRRGVRHGYACRQSAQENSDKRDIKQFLLEHYEAGQPEWQRAWRDALENADYQSMRRLHSQHASQLEVHALVTSRAFNLTHERTDGLTLLCMQHHAARNNRSVREACMWFLRICGHLLPEPSIREAFNRARHMGHTFLVGKLLQSHWAMLCSGPEDEFLQEQLECAAHYGHDGQCGLIIDMSVHQGHPLQPHRALKDAIACSESGNTNKPDHALRICNRLMPCDPIASREAINCFEDWGAGRMQTPLERARRNLEIHSAQPSRSKFQAIVDALEQLQT